VIKTSAFKRLLELYRTTDKDIYLYDFDGYNHIEMNKSLKDCINDPDMKFGHSFVIYHCLEKLK
jgi:hypothetical protein